MVSFDKEKYLKNKPPPPPQGLDKLCVTARCEFVLKSNLKKAFGSGWSGGIGGSLGLVDLEGQRVCGNTCKIQGAEGWGGLGEGGVRDMRDVIY